MAYSIFHNWDQMKTRNHKDQGRDQQFEEAVKV